MTLDLARDWQPRLGLLIVGSSVLVDAGQHHFLLIAELNCFGECLHDSPGSYFPLESFFFGYWALLHRL